MEDTDNADNRFSSRYENSKQVQKEEYLRDKENEQIWEEMGNHSRREKLNIKRSHRNQIE